MGAATCVRFDQTGGYLGVGGEGGFVMCAPKQDYSVVREFKDMGKGKDARPRSVCYGTDCSFVTLGAGDHNLRIFA